MRRSLLALALSLSLLAAFLLALGPDRVGAVLATTNPWVFALGLLAMLATLLCWSEGLRPLLVDAGGEVASRRLFLAYSTAMLGRQLLPMGAIGGPALTAYTVDRESALSYNETLAVVTVAEFLSTIASLLLIVAGVPYLLFVAPVAVEIRLLAVGIAGFVLLLAALSLVFWYRRGAVERVVSGALALLQRTLGKLSDRLDAALDPHRAGAGLDRYYTTVDTLAGNRRTLVRSFALHQVGWVCSTLPLYTAALAVGVDLPIALALFLVPVSDFAGVLPLPGGLGGVEIVLAGLLAAVLGIDLALATAVALLYRLCSYWFLILVGAVTGALTATTLTDLADEVRE